jgi:hypothetical protein
MMTHETFACWQISSNNRADVMFFRRTLIFAVFDAEAAEAPCRAGSDEKVVGCEIA